MREGAAMLPLNFISKMNNQNSLPAIRMRKIELDITELRKLYDSNMSLEAIAEKLGINYHTLLNKLRPLKWKREPRIRKVNLDVKEILKLRELGLTKEEMMKKFHVSRKAFVKFEKENGIFVEDTTRLDAYNKAQKTLKERKQDGLGPESHHNWSRLDNFKDDIQELLLQGVTRVDIAKRYNVCLSTIYNFIVLHNLNAPIIKKLDNKEEKIIELFNQGLSVKLIAKEVGCCHSYLEDKIKELNLHRNLNQVKYSSHLRQEENTIIKLYQAGVLGTEIAKQLHVHPVSIYRKIKALKLKRT